MELNFDKLSGYRGNNNTMCHQLQAGYSSLLWKDSVYESFGNYVDECNSIISKMDGLMEEMQSVCDSLQEVNIDNLTESCNSLLTQID